MASDSSPKPSDRRTEPRIEARIEVRFAESEDAARALKAFSINFSPSGLCLKTQREYQLGAKLHLAMTVNGQDFDLLAVVAWVHRGVIGVRFADVTTSDRLRLEGLAAVLQASQG